MNEVTTERLTWEWPAGKEVAVCLTFDFDADVGLAWQGLDGKLTSSSELRFGARRGVHRLLEVLAARDLKATFYVPGETALRHPAEVTAVAAAGHQIGHHGHLHLFNDRADEAQQRDELRRGTAALEDLLGERPRGYRSPGWELTPYSLELLVEAGFAWDSSCMGDDRPYVERHGDSSILELPVHWSLDDWVYYGFQRDAFGHMSDPAAMSRVFAEEYRSALRERRLVTYTLHPECSGRGYRALALEQLLDEWVADERAWFATHGEVAAAVALDTDLLTA
jgi:peptidoglycan-N-acetylglucosamine deacetylase